MNVIHLAEVDARMLSEGLDAAVKLLDSMQALSPLESEWNGEAYKIKRGARFLHKELGDDAVTDVPS